MFLLTLEFLHLDFGSTHKNLVFPDGLPGIFFPLELHIPVSLGLPQLVGLDDVGDDHLAKLLLESPVQVIVSDGSGQLAHKHSPRFPLFLGLLLAPRLAEEFSAAESEESSEEEVSVPGVGDGEEGVAFAQARCTVPDYFQVGDLAHLAERPAQFLVADVGEEAADKERGLGLREGG